MQEYLLCGFDFVVAPLVHGDHKEPALRRPDGDTAPPREREELMLQSAQFGGQVSMHHSGHCHSSRAGCHAGVLAPNSNLSPMQIVGRTSSWIDPDSSDPVFAKRSSQALSQELSWAAFLGLQAVIVTPNPKATSIVNLAQIINKVGSSRSSATDVLLLLYLALHKHTHQPFKSSPQDPEPRP